MRKLNLILTLILLVFSSVVFATSSASDSSAKHKYEDERFGEKKDESDRFKFARVKTGPVYPWNYDAQGLMQTKDLFDSAVYSYGVNYLGLPAGVVPIDLVEDLPAGIQLVGRRFREDVIFDAMAAIEQRAGLLVSRLWERNAG